MVEWDGNTGDRDQTPVVGVGASAGGLEAFTRLLRNVPTDTGCAFVLVQHLDASHASSLSEILGRATALPIGEASDGMRVEPNRIFVIPPNTELTIEHRVLKLSPRARPPVPHMPIDRFLQSLAEDCGASAMGIILSGAGSDGAAGLMAIKEAGGVTFAQEPTTAEFPSMPTMAAFAGGVDIILPPEGIATALARLALRSPLTAASIATAPAHLVDDDANELHDICALMHEATGIDFALYRETTVLRRVVRRLALRGMDSVSDYTRLLAADPEERAALQRDLLIGVTCFFRDPAAFDALKTLVFPAIIAARDPGATIRIWVPGCASGEEAYSILIAFHEFQRANGLARRVQMFASDISESAVFHARVGVYPETIAANVSPLRLEQHFTKVDGGYQIGKSFREQCIFSRHNLLDDPPFSKLDLISCRNVLIYLDSVQKRIIPLFHYALLDHGFLMLGKSETAHFADLFATVEPRLRIYSKRRVANKPYGFLSRPIAQRCDADAGQLAGVPPAVRGGGDFSRDADRVLLSKYSPAGVLVNENLEVIEIRGQPVPFLALTAGKVSFHLLKLIPDTGLFLEVERLVQEAAATDMPARRDRFACVGNHVGEVSIEVTPLRSRERRAYLILFESETGITDPRPELPGVVTASERQVVELKRQLEAARLRLESLVEDHETSDQENQQVTEDALSANEELQSLAEELETAKEELQSTNEELISVNRDLESRNIALASAGAFAKSIVETVRVPLIVVDTEFTIRHVNASFARVFLVSPRELEGQPFYVACDRAWDVPELRHLVADVLAKGEAFDSFEVERKFQTVGTRSLVLSGRRLEQLELALLTIEDVTEFREAERALRESEDQRRQAEKTEAIGRLAGGIAHDFNNLLTVIVGDCGLLSEMLEHDPALEYVGEIERSAARAAALTDQLLSFSRRKVLQPKVFDLNPVVVEFNSMLRRLLGAHIELIVNCAPDLWSVRADAGEIGRVLMNLCLNARDAMPAGGTLTIETANEPLDDAGAKLRGVPTGRYVRLTVRDTGLGMDGATRAHLFEPFFSTKHETNRGTGLGLPTVLGIVQQSGGAIWCDSARGRGTEFAILLPVGEVRTGQALAGSPQATERGGSEVIFVVEDEEGVRVVQRRILTRLGYVVLEASSGPEALALMQAHEGAIDLLISDLVMPQMGGREFAERAVALRPALKVLFVSGYTEDGVLKDGIARGAAFLQKPFTPASLASKVRAILDSAPNAL